MLQSLRRARWQALQPRDSAGIVAPMRVIALTGAFVILAACAASPPAIPGPSPAPSVATASPPARSRAALMLAAAGGPQAPTRAEIERELGPAEIAREEGAGAALTYRFEHCALLLLFAGDELRLAEANASARRGGETAPSLDQCAAEAPAR